MPPRSSHRTVRARVTAGATLVLFAAMVVAAIVSYGLLHRALIAEVDASLQARLDEVIGLTVEGRLTAVLVPTGQDLAQVQVIDSSGAVIAATPGLAAGTRLDIVEPPIPGTESKATVDGARIGGKPGDDYRLVARTVVSGTRSVTMYAVTSLVTATRAESALRVGLAIGLPFVVALAALVIWQVTGRALAPVDAMRAEVDQIQATDLTRRVQPAGGDSEMDRLGTTLNHMLDRLQEASDRQQLFAASASHELRSPLSAIRTELEVGLAYPDRAEWPGIATESLIEVARLEGLARDLRTLTASWASRASAERRCDLWVVVTDEVARRQPARDVRYVVDGSGPQPVTTDSDTSAHVIRNLLDNAERHATSTITVTVSMGETPNDHVELVIANDGTPIPPEMSERIFEPFTRLDEARSLDSGGSGLGLAIARSVLVAAGGSLAVDPLERGAAFRARFPSRRHSESANRVAGPGNPDADGPPEWSG